MTESAMWQDRVEREKVHVVCAGCARVLDYDNGLKEFVHGSAQTNDHPVEPIRAQEFGWERVIVRCDFCGHDKTATTIWTVPADTFDEPVIPGDRPRRSVGDWAACRECRHLVFTGRWPDLVTRVLVQHDLPAGPGMARDWVTALYAKLQSNVTGPPYRGVSKNRN